MSGEIGKGSVVQREGRDRGLGKGSWIMFRPEQYENSNTSRRWGKSNILGTFTSDKP